LFTTDVFQCTLEAVSVQKACQLQLIAGNFLTCQSAHWCQ